MQNCKRNGNGRNSCCGHKHQHGEKNCRKNCNNNSGICQSHGKNRGKKRELFIKKYNEYLNTIELPEFETDEQYQQWIANTDEGQSYLKNIDRINTEIDAECPWGGKRENAGRRQECVRKIPYTRRISSELIKVLKDYAKEHGITETEALEKAIDKLN